jgi:hypothetical protein
LTEFEVAEDVQLGDDELDEVMGNLEVHVGQQVEEALLQVLAPLTHDVVQEQKKRGAG